MHTQDRPTDGLADTRQTDQYTHSHTMQADRPTHAHTRLADQTNTHAPTRQAD